jgi:hypothetical protein
MIRHWGPIPGLGNEHQNLTAFPIPTYSKPSHRIDSGVFSDKLPTHAPSRLRLPNSHSVSCIMKSDDFASVTYLMGYFHQDWKADHGPDPMAVLDYFCREESVDLVRSCTTEIRKLLHSNCSDEEIVEILEKQLSGGPPYEHVREVRDWLETAADRIDTFLSQSGSE